MGTDIIAYCEKRIAKKWKICMPDLSNQRSSFNIPRVTATFQVLSRLYGDKYGLDFKSISDNRGLPNDVSDDVKRLLTRDNGEIFGHSYVSLRELDEFEWNDESEQYDAYKEIVAEELFEIIDFMRRNNEENITKDDIRIVFGYSS